MYIKISNLKGEREADSVPRTEDPLTEHFPETRKTEKNGWCTRIKAQSRKAKLPVGSRTTVQQRTWVDLTAGFGMGPGVSPPLWPSNLSQPTHSHCHIYRFL